MKKAGPREAFLIAYRATANVSEACRQARIGRTTAYEWRRDEPEFATAWDEAQEVAVDQLEEAARKRALDGSDVLMIFLLKANRPDKYRETTRLDVAIGKASNEQLIDYITAGIGVLAAGETEGGGGVEATGDVDRDASLPSGSASRETDAAGG